VKEARARGFRVLLYHIHVSSPELARERVVTRVSRGRPRCARAGIHARYPRTLQWIRQAAEIADRTYVIDNSLLGRSHRHVMTLERGKIVFLSDNVPTWAREAYADAIEALTQEPR
jgi:predicted ABC-type ATPase